jgi:hypothetical protein
MARYFTDREKDEIRAALIELQQIVNPFDFPAKGEQARKLVAFLDERPTHPACLIAYEFGRLRRLWNRLERTAQSQPTQNP